METQLMSKYDLRDLHAEIDYFDRKVAYCQTLEKFPSEDERAAALRKLVTKRERLVKVALEQVRRGVEYDPKLLPRSFKAAANETVATQLPAVAAE